MKINNRVASGGMWRVVKSQGERPMALTLTGTTYKSEMIQPTSQTPWYYLNLGNYW